MRLKRFILLSVVAAGIYLSIQHYQPPYTAEINPAEIPVFHEAGLGYNHEYKSGKSLPIAGAAAFDLDADYIPELFIGGGYLQRDELFKFKDGKFISITQEVGLSKEFGDSSYGAASIDVNNDDYTDLFIARDSGIYLYLNDKGYLRPQKLNIPLDENKALPVSISLADINGDGYVDIFLANHLPPAYIQTYSIFNQVNYGARSQLLLNNGDNLSFTDITEQAGLGFIGNAVNAIFADFNGDQLIDLAIAHAAGHIQIFKNKGDLTFFATPNPSTIHYAYPMGLAAADYDNNGTLDLFSATTGSSVPDFIARGDLKRNQLFHNKWILLNNKGEWIFSDLADEAMLANYEMGRGAVFADFNLDGLQDLVVTTNFIDYPLHQLLKSNAKLLIQREGGYFTAVQSQAQLKNKYFGSTAITADFNNDGYPDLVFVNVGSPAKAYINNGGNRHYTKLILKDTPSTIGSRITLETSTKKHLTHHFIVGGNLASDQNHALLFGLNFETSIRKIEVLYPNGRTLTLTNPAIDSTLLIATPEETLSEILPNKISGAPPNEDNRHNDTPVEKPEEWAEPKILQVPGEHESSPLTEPSEHTEPD